MSQTDRPPVGWQTFTRASAARAASRRGVLARVKRLEARPSWISFRTFRASLLSMVKDTTDTPNGILRFACQCVEDEAKFKKKGGWLNC